MNTHKRNMGVVAMLFCYLRPWLLFIALVLATVASSQVRVSQFGARPNDGKSDINAIRKAIESLKGQKWKKLIFEQGTYDLPVEDASKTIALEVQGMHDVMFEGAPTLQGEPGTVFLRHFPFQNNIAGEPILKVSDCFNFSINNILFDNAPRYATAGEVIANDGKSITVRIFEGNPLIDKSLFYCGNSWNLKTKSLLQVASITYGADVTKKATGYTWHIQGKPSDRLMKLTSTIAAGKVQVGDGLSWHFGYQGIQVLFENCKNLRVSNVSTYSAIGFCMAAYFCENIQAENVKVIPPDNQLTVGSRDGWKLYACSGTITMNNIYMEGVRWDGQNVHASFLWPYQIINARKVWFRKKHGTAFPIKGGSIIG
ncbi:MAG: hypothetical protein EOO88_48355, partial [Pedobacter sp.]